MLAARNGWTDVVKQLIEKGADINAKGMSILQSCTLLNTHYTF